MSDAFDGAGKGFKEPSLLAALVMILLVVAVLVAALLFASGALRDRPGVDAQVNPPGLESVPPES